MKGTTTTRRELLEKRQLLGSMANTAAAKPLVAALDTISRQQREHRVQINALKSMIAHHKEDLYHCSYAYGNLSAGYNITRASSHFNDLEALKAVLVAQIDLSALMYRALEEEHRRYILNMAILSSAFGSKMEQKSPKNHYRQARLLKQLEDIQRFVLKNGQDEAAQTAREGYLKEIAQYWSRWDRKGKEEFAGAWRFVAGRKLVVWSR